jgi:hypothetical protein
LSGDYGAICTELVDENPDFNIQVLGSAKEMVERNIYEQYNIDFQSGKLFSSTPDWCPIK